jgi:protein-S-isoprenylcysteine O-methyltransferase Ste14
MNALETRIPPPLVMVIFSALMWMIAHYTHPLMISHSLRLWATAAFIVIGLAFALPAVFAFQRKNTTINPHRIERASALVTSGPFRFSRNPMYTGMVFLLLAWTCYLANPWAVVGPILFELYILRFQIWPEERAMQDKFGADYLAYVGKVRRWL